MKLNTMHPRSRGRPHSTYFCIPVKSHHIQAFPKKSRGPFAHNAAFYRRHPFNLPSSPHHSPLSSTPLPLLVGNTEGGGRAGGFKLLPTRNLNCTGGGTGNGGGVGCTGGKVVCSPLYPRCSLPPAWKKGGPPLTIPPPLRCSL